MRTTLIAVAWLALGMNPVLAQHGAKGVAAVAAGANPAVQAHGSFRRMQHRKDFSAQVALKDAASGPGAYGVGALADLAGEITIHDGSVFISHDKTMDGRIDQRQAGDAQAVRARSSTHTCSTRRARSLAISTPTTLPPARCCCCRPAAEESRRWRYGDPGSLPNRLRLRHAGIGNIAICDV